MQPHSQKIEASSGPDHCLKASESDGNDDDNDNDGGGDHEDDDEVAAVDGQE